MPQVTIPMCHLYFISVAHLVFLTPLPRVQCCTYIINLQCCPAVNYSSVLMLSCLPEYNVIYGFIRRVFAYSVIDNIPKP